MFSVGTIEKSFYLFGSFIYFLLDLLIKCFIIPFYFHCWLSRYCLLSKWLFLGHIIYIFNLLWSFFKKYINTHIFKNFTLIYFYLSFVLLSCVSLLHILQSPYYIIIYFILNSELSFKNIFKSKMSLMFTHTLPLLMFFMPLCVDSNFHLYHIFSSWRNYSDNS